MENINVLKYVSDERIFIENSLKKLIEEIGDIPIANTRIMPFGWRKAAKGRTVWRILEEIITQNLELKAEELGYQKVALPESEVGVYDLEFVLINGKKAFINIKSAVEGVKKSKDDISKATGLIEFYKSHPNDNLYIATFVLQFNRNMTVKIINCVVYPVAWIPDVYVNPSNNGNLQSSEYKYISKAIERTNDDFLRLLTTEYIVAQDKKRKKILK